MLNLLQANKLSLVDMLPASVMERIRLKGRSVAYSDRQLIQNRGDTKADFCIVESGQVLAGNIGTDGAFLTTMLFSPGDYFGEFSLLAGLPRTQSLWAIGDTTITHLGSAVFQRLFDNEPEFSRALLVTSLRRIHFLVEFLDGQRRWPLPVRTAHLLLTSVEDGVDKDSQEVHCRQEDIAYMLGVSRVAIGKALKELESEALIETRYGSVVIPDVPQLFAWFDEHQQITKITPPKIPPQTRS